MTDLPRNPCNHCFTALCGTRPCWENDPDDAWESRATELLQAATDADANALQAQRAAEAALTQARAQSPWSTDTREAQDHAYQLAQAHWAARSQARAAWNAFQEFTQFFEENTP